MFMNECCGYKQTIFHENEKCFIMIKNNCVDKIFLIEYERAL